MQHLRLGPRPGALSDKPGRLRPPTGYLRGTVAAVARLGAKTTGGNQVATTQPKLNPSALSLADAARLLSAAGGRSITVEMLAADRNAGAPANPDGTLNLVHYAAWLVKEMSGRGD